MMRLGTRAPVGEPPSVDRTGTAYGIVPWSVLISRSDRGSCFTATCAALNGDLLQINSAGTNKIEKPRKRWKRMNGIQAAVAVE
jgi:hypothetical protein